MAMAGSHSSSSRPSSSSRAVGRLGAAVAIAVSAASLSWAPTAAQAGVLPPAATRASSASAPASALVLTARQAGAIEANQTTPTQLDPLFPTNVGFQGTTKYGARPFLAQNNPVNASAHFPGGVANTTYYAGRQAAVEANYQALNQTDADFRLDRHWGNNSPYFPSPLFPEWQTQRQLDPQCSIQQVQVLHRHGSRFPTSDATEGAPAFGLAIQQVKGNASAGTGPALNASGPLEFLNSWTYQLGAEVLVPNGAKELFDSGVKSWYQYGALYDPKTQPHKPVVRTTSQERMMESARYFTAGFFGLDAPNLINLEVILEGAGFNNTLAPYDTCNDSNTIEAGDTVLDPKWKSTYLANATSRLQPHIPGLNLTADLVYGMQSLCAYETVGLGSSSFCQLFTQEEWEGFEYALDLEFWGDYSFGSQTGRAQGVGLAQDVLARLTNTTIDPALMTMQNTSLLNSTFFPLDQLIYLDFTHDDVLASVLTAFNYTQVLGETLDPSHPQAKRTDKLSHITPYAARLVFEIVSCPTTKVAASDSSSSGGNNATNQSGQQAGEELLIRTLLNDAFIPMTAAQGCSTHRSDGACSLHEFVSYQQKHILEAAQFSKACFGNYTAAVVNNGTVAP